LKLFRDLPQSGHATQGVALTIGNFDGVHLGHQALLARTFQAARERGLISAAMTFEPHPREFFDPGSAPARLSSLREKVEYLSVAGVEQLYVCRFNKIFADQSPQAFIDVLQRRLQCRWLLVGDDFRFGAGRSGDVALLRSEGARRGFELATLDNIELGGLRISSTAVRDALTAGDFALVRDLLGRPYAVSGHVLHGRKLGRTLGFPTANVSLARRKPALTGVFAVKCFGIHARGLEGVATGVANLGTNPAVKSDGKHSLEVFLFDFSSDLYGNRISVEFCAKLRDEAHFSSLDALTRQIQRDCDAAREFFRD
jgi:riboflavin kinase/FMN adenylyltransferase